MKGRDILKSLTEAKAKPLNANAGHQSKAAGSVKALKSELDKITEQAAEAKSLREAISKTGGIVDLDVSCIDGATIADRIPFEFDPELDTLTEAIARAGQQVPILVRPHPTEPSRYQAAYGHRRLAAATQLGIPVKAVVRVLTDDEMVIAQGQENGSRQDLSFVERASYASRLLQSGHTRELVCQALGVDKPEVSRLLTVANAVSAKMMSSIGPAPQIGRPRWTELAQTLKNCNALAVVNELIDSSSLTQVRDSNERFNLVYMAALSAVEPKKAKQQPKKQNIQGLNGEPMGWHQANKKGVTLTVQNREFSEFLVSRLPDLVAEFGAIAEKEMKNQK